MKHLLSLWMCLAAIGARSAPSVTYTYQVIRVYPHDTGAFTQGLIHHNGFFYESTGLYGSSVLRKVELETGAVLQQRDLDAAHFGEGITALNGKMFQITWREHRAFVYDKETLERLDTFTYATEGWGLATDGEHLIMSDGSSSISFRDPESFAELYQITVREGLQPVTRINELECVNGELWANIPLCSSHIPSRNPWLRSRFPHSGSFAINYKKRTN